jgi:hypothetical protein
MASTKAIAERDVKIADLRAKLDKLRASTYQDVWLDELDKLELVVEEGIRTKWLYGQKQFTFKKMTGKNVKRKK